MERYGIPEDRIFFSRDLSFEESVMNATRKKGVDVVLNSLSGDALRASWRCLAHFGRFVEIGKQDLLANGKLEMGPFIHNRTYAAVDLLALSVEKPHLMKKLLNETIKLYTAGVSKLSPMIKSYQLSEVESAFRSMQKGDSIGKIVLIPQPQDRLKVSHQFFLNPLYISYQIITESDLL